MSTNTAYLFSQDFIEGLTWETGVSQPGVTILGVGGGLVPPTPRQGRAGTHAILPMWADVKRPQVKHICTVYIGCGHWLCAVFRPDLALDGRGYLAGPPPIDWDVHACYHSLT